MPQIKDELNSSKKHLFDCNARFNQIDKTITESKLSDKIEIELFNGLLINYAKKNKANILIRGIRNISDFEYEINMANTNKLLAPDIETIFLPTSPQLMTVSSSMVKEIASCGGDISQFVPPSCCKGFTVSLRARLSGYLKK
jgi:pantetheine-phosphate adenylyltransferase